MEVSYDVFTEAFLQKITEYELLEMQTTLRDRLVFGYMTRALAELIPICSGYFNVDYDTENSSVLIDTMGRDWAQSNLDEIVNIVSEGMIVQWLKPFANRQENLETTLNTKDFSTYSPASLLDKICERYKLSKKEYKQMVFEYTYAHGNLKRLHL